MLIWERATSIGNASSRIWKPDVPKSISSIFRFLTCEPKNLANTAATELQVHFSKWKQQDNAWKTDTTHLPRGLSATDSTSSGCLTCVRHSRSSLTPILDKSQFSTLNFKSGLSFWIAHEIKGTNDLRCYMQLIQCFSNSTRNSLTRQQFITNIQKCCVLSRSRGNWRVTWKHNSTFCIDYYGDGQSVMSASTWYLHPWLGCHLYPNHLS